MRKKLIIGITSIMLGFSMPGMTESADASRAEIVSSVSFRSAPSTASKVMKFLKVGQAVTVLETTNNYWLKVRDGEGQTGYVSSNKKYVQLIDTPSVPVANAQVVKSVSLRLSPSTNADRIRYLNKNESLIITQVVNSYWYAVKDASGVTGYVSSQAQYVKVTGELPSSSKPVDSATPSASIQIEKLIAAGMSYLGTKYEYASNRNTTDTFDCSDFVRQAIKDAWGVVIPASSSSQGAYVRNKNEVTADWKQLKRGDLMFFMSYKGTKASSYANKSSFTDRITHVGLYLGNGQVLHTYSDSSGGVRIDNIKGKHWEYRFLFGGSAL